MKFCGKALIALILIGLMVMPSAVFSQAMPVPLDTAVLPGVSTIQYAGQTFVFTTSVGLKVKFRAISMSEFEMEVRALPGHTSSHSGSATSSTEEIVINWKDYNQNILDGDTSKLPWDGILTTEGGWTEK